MSEKLRKQTAIVLLEKRIAELTHYGRSQSAILRSIGIWRIEDLYLLNSLQLLDLLSILRERQLGLFDVA